MLVAGQLTNGNLGGSSTAFLGARDGISGGLTRRVQCTAVTPAGSYDFTLVAHRQQNNANSISARITGGNLSVYIGANDTSGPLSVIAGILSSTTYTMAIDVVVSGGLLVAFSVWLNGVLQYQHACTVAQQYGSAGSDPFLTDGLIMRTSGANAVVVTDYRVLPVEVVPATLTSGSETLVAGTVSVSLPSIAATSIVRLNRQSAGGTLGQLSVALTAGTGFAINSSSGSDTSVVFWELVRI
jgi:hypothetical protein